MSGSRLLRSFYRDPTGTERAHHSAGDFFDAHLGIRCAGLDRCVPVNPTITGAVGSFVYYTDPNCKDAVVELRTDERKYLRLVQPAGGGAHWHQVGPAISGPLFSRAAGQCQPAARPGFPVHRIGARVELSTFVAFTQRRERLTDRLEMVVSVGEDGSRRPASLHDLRTGLACALRIAQDGAWRCLPPRDLYLSDHFADANCNTPAFSPFDDYGRTAIGLGCVIALDPSCQRRATVHEFVAAKTFARAGTACMPGPSSPPSYASFRVVPPSDFAAASPVSVGTGRLTYEDLQIEGTRLPSPTRFAQDTELGTDCQPARTKDGKIRCVPTHRPQGFGFLDPGCKRRGSRLAASSCSSPPALSLIEADGAAAFRVGARGTGPFFLMNGSSCVIADPGPVAFIELVEVPPAELIELVPASR